ncbi:MAG: hypothetical protein KJI71_00460 [Patescibacteria group bacterium]|nr:hypothetical protein [Patescibacteria group bacterium]
MTKVYDNSKKFEIPIFKERDYQNLVIALELIYINYWGLLNERIQRSCEKEVLKLIHYLYKIFKEKKEFNKSPCLTIGNLELILILVNDVLKEKVDNDLKNAQALLSDFFKAFYGQFDIIVEN